jgi:putative oxidoreductase
MNLALSFNFLNRLLATTGDHLRSVLLLVVRLYWGWSFFNTGGKKLMHLEGTAAYFAELHLPAAKLNAFMAGTVECVGGLLLLLGLATRISCTGLIFTMLVAYATAEREALYAILSDTDKFTGAAPFLFLFAALIVFVFGPGKISLDTLFFKNTGSKA